MYEGYWNLKEKPFENTPDPRFIYLSQKHEEALSRLIYAIREQKGAALLTGEYGSGKTLISRVILNELSADNYKLAFIFNPKLTSEELLREIIYQLGGETAADSSKTDLLHKLNEILYKNNQEGKNSVVLIDEAQAIPEDSGFEELRLLLNFQLNDRFLITLILMGQPELKEKIERVPQFRQRISVAYHLTALSKKETKLYVKHRLTVAGAGPDIFSGGAFSELHRFSAGIPRRINNICDIALLVGSSKKSYRVTKRMIKDVSMDLGEVPMDMEQKLENAING
ncbi:MAG: AAA family ATPase [Candidatus Omnitrophica bacterium]|nr:AAA family ATPase [Candidatus Omnitrophota bacterium]MDD5611055.1 AAA family ATPase [Candidatus Omnitrophota bacterium]